MSTSSPATVRRPTKIGVQPGREGSTVSGTTSGPNKGYCGTSVNQCLAGLTADAAWKVEVLCLAQPTNSIAGSTRGQGTGMMFPSRHHPSGVSRRLRSMQRLRWGFTVASDVAFLPTVETKPQAGVDLSKWTILESAAGVTPCLDRPPYWSHCLSPPVFLSAVSLG